MLPPTSDLVLDRSKLSYDDPSQHKTHATIIVHHHRSGFVMVSLWLHDALSRPLSLSLSRSRSLTHSLTQSGDKVAVIACYSGHALYRLQVNQLGEEGSRTRAALSISCLAPRTISGTRGHNSRRRLLQRRHDEMMMMDGVPESLRSTPPASSQQRTPPPLLVSPPLSGTKTIAGIFTTQRSFIHGSST